MPVTNSPLRYPGGKSQLAPLVLEILRENNLHGGVYAEPFAGGAGIAWKLLLNGDVSEVWINDLDRAIFSFWSVAVYDPDPLCERLLAVRVTMEEWARQRSVLGDVNASLQDLAFATIFLNRTNRSGILKGGVIGGKEQRGDYRLDCRFNRAELVEKIRRIHNLRDVITVSNLDAEQCLRNWNKALPRRGIINIDPPYYVQGRDLYMSFYGHENHVSLAKQITKMRAPWMLTYDDVVPIQQIYSGVTQYKLRLTYYAQIKRKASELLLLSPQLKASTTLTSSAAA